jgi:hypothetical protein
LPGLEEERRLAYVGLTRARRRALVSFAANRRIHGQWQASARSRFVDELPKDQIEVETEYGLGPGAGWAATPAANAAWGTGWSEGTQGGYRKSLPRPPLVIDGTRPPSRGQEVRGSAGLRSATACSTRNLATASSGWSRTTSSKSILSTPATRR